MNVKLGAGQGPSPLTWLGLLVFFGLLACGYSFHEPWRDEIQAWLMARDMDVPALAANAGAEGHPIGWHLVLKLFQALGLPFESVQLFSVLCALASGLLLLRRSPFPRFLVWLFLFSPMLLLLGIWARPYSLIVLLLLAQAALFKERQRRPFFYALILGALAQLMVLGLPYAGMMALWWLWESPRSGAGRRVYMALGLLFCCLLLSVLQLLPPPDKASLMLGGRGHIMAAWFRSGGFFSLSLPALAGLLVAAAIGVCWSLMLLRGHIMLMGTALVSALFYVLINYWVYPLSPCHWYTLFAMLLALTWTALANFSQSGGTWRARLLVPLSLACLALYPGGVSSYYQELTLPSSNLPLAVDFVRESLGDVPAAGHTLARVCPLLKDMPGRRFWNPVNRRWGSFAVFDADWQKHKHMSMTEAARIILEHCPAGRPAMLFSSPWEGAEPAGYYPALELCRPTVYEENLYIYLPLERPVPAFVAESSVNTCGE